MANKLITIDYEEYLELERVSKLVNEVKQGIRIETHENHGRYGETAVVLSISTGDKLIELMEASIPVTDVSVTIDEEARRISQEKLDRRFFR